MTLDIILRTLYPHFTIGSRIARGYSGSSLRREWSGNSPRAIEHLHSLNLFLILVFFSFFSYCFSFLFVMSHFLVFFLSFLYYFSFIFVNFFLSFFALFFLSFCILSLPFSYSLYSLFVFFLFLILITWHFTQNKTMVLFCQMSLPTDGSTRAQTPMSQLVDLVTSPDFTFRCVFGKIC